MRHASIAVLVLASTAPSIAQGNTIPGLGSRLTDMPGPVSFGRLGTHPTGRSGFAFGITICNNGTVPIDWRAPMDPAHPMYAFLFCRESNGRFVQISDRSWLKHAYASANGNCGGCIIPPAGSAQVGVNCNDAYGAGSSADRYWLGAPTEIDPWLQTWNPIGSQFDRGEPPVAGPAAFDGVRSLTRAMADGMDPVKHRVQVYDDDLATAGTFVVATRILTTGEGDGTREDNMASRRVVPNWNGTQWTFAGHTSLLAGSPLLQWSGATVRSATNGSDDGRVYLAGKVTQLANGQWHYEYAVHNRDHGRGIAAVRIPKCRGARITAAGSRDIDRSSFNDWALQVQAEEVVFLAGVDNAIEWNTIHNFWFDSDAAPWDATTTLVAARPGPGAPEFGVTNVLAPLQLRNLVLGDGCGSPAPGLFAFGVPSIARIPNPSFGVLVQGAPGTGTLFFAALASGSTALPGGCMQWLDSGSLTTTGFATTAANGFALHPQPIPANASLEGLSVGWQAAQIVANGPLLGQFTLSNGLLVRIGNATPGCP